MTKTMERFYFEIVILELGFVCDLEIVHCDLTYLILPKGNSFTMQSFIQSRDSLGDSPQYVGHGDNISTIENPTRLI